MAKLLNVIDLSFDTKAILGGYESITLKRKWNGYDFMNLTINKAIPGADKLVQDNIVFLDKEYDNAFIIERVVERLDGNSTMLDVQATHINSLLADYITYPYPFATADAHVITGTREAVARGLVNYNAISPENSNRIQYPIVLGTIRALGDSITYSSRFKNLDEEIKAVLSTQNLGWNLWVNMTTKKFVFEVYAGKDRTYTQSTNARILFGIKYGNLASYEKTIDKTSEKNVAVVGGQGEGKDRTIVRVVKSGITRKKEVFVDARDINDTTQLTERGNQKLSESQAIDNMSFQIVNKQFKYRIDWELGDFVTITFPDGSYLNKQVVAVTEVYEKGKIEVSPEFGTNAKTLESVVGSIEDRISQLETTETNTNNYSVSNATAITVSTSTPTIIASCTITTHGKPVLIVGTGDANPAGDGAWHRLRLFRDSTAIGKNIIDQCGAASTNNPFALCFIDTPVEGTYTYSIKAWQGAGTITYGEEGDVQAPTICVVELN